MPLRLATWNINSVRIRIHLVRMLAEELAPDILCLQETKTEDGTFPLQELKDLGYPHIAFAGQKAYNGVAVLSKIPLEGIETMDMLHNGEQRHIAVTLPHGIRLHNFYVPAGGDIPDPHLNPKFRDKLAFVDAMREWSKPLPKNHKSIVLGDFNIAPLEHDVWSHKQLLDVVSHTPVEVEKLTTLRESAGWVDAARHFTPADEKLYSWWSYRNRDWKKSSRGRRLDHIWISPDLQNTLKACIIPAHARDWERPSDHVPVIVDIAL